MSNAHDQWKTGGRDSLPSTNPNITPPAANPSGEASTDELPPPGGEIGAVGRRLADLQIVRAADWRGAVAKAGEGADLEQILGVLRSETRKWAGCRTPAPLVTKFMADEILAGFTDPL
ncbi:MAG: hypothetical protein ACRDD1_09760, partial [Planctomycetia bacterium]